MPDAVARAAPVVVAGLLVAAAIFLRPYSHLATAAGWLAGLVLLFVAARRAAACGDEQRRPEIGPPVTRRFEVVGLGGAVAVAAMLRFAFLADVPSFIHNDESLFVADAIWRAHAPMPAPGPFAEVPWGWFPDLFGSGWNSFPALSTFLHWTPVMLFGPSNAALRFGCAVVGTATVLVLFLWVRRWWGGFAAVAAAWALALASEHVYWSRVALNNVDVALLGAAALGAFAWTVDTRQPRAWVALGIVLGLGFHTYHGAKLHLPLTVATFAVAGLTGRLRFGRDDLRGAGWATFALVLTVAPLLPDILATWDRWLLDHSGRLDIEPLAHAWAARDWSRIEHYFLHHYYETTHLFRTTPWLTRLAIAGALVACVRVFDLRFLTLLIWGGAVLLLGSFTVGWRSARLISLAPMFAACAGLAVAQARALGGRFVAGYASAWPARAAAAIVTAALVVFLVQEAWHATFVGRSEIRNATYGWCRLLERVPLPATVFVTGVLEGTDQRHARGICALPDHPARRIVALAAAEPVPASLPDDPVVVAVVGAGGDDTLASLRARPGAVVLPFRDRGRPLFHVVWLRTPTAPFSPEPPDLRWRISR